MALDPGPLAALVAGGAMGALMRWAGPRARAWRRQLEARPVLHRVMLLGAAGAAIAGAAVAAAHPAWLDDAITWAQQDGGPALEPCLAADGADRPAVALARLLAACRHPPA